MYLISNIIMSICFVTAVNEACYDLDSIQADYWWYRLVHSSLITFATVFATFCHAYFNASCAMLMVVILSLLINFGLDTAYAKHHCSKRTQKVLQTLTALAIVMLCYMYEAVSIM